MQITLTIPSDYSEITLKQWLVFLKELENYKDNDEATTSLLLHHLCGLDYKYIAGLSVSDINIIKNELSSFISNTELPFQQFITIDGKEYGFEPNLSNMSYGAYLDITKWDTFTIDDNWTKIMNILYRPVVSKQGALYTIKPYDGTGDADKFLEVGMDVHFGTLFFLLNLSTDLLSATLKSLKVTELHPSIKSILERSGKDIPRLLNLQQEIYRDWTKYLKNH